MEKRYRDVFENNRAWVASKTAKDADYFKRQAATHDPDFLFIGCSDSRVSANEIMGLEPGEIFVHRNIANVVVNTDINCQSVIQYAVQNLGVKYIIICGHYGCGGVAAAMQSEDMGLLNGWLREVRDVYRLHRDELDAIEDMHARYRRLVELNITEQTLNVIKTAVVQKSYLQRGYPTVHGWIYDIEDGVLEDLDIPFEKSLAQVREIYRLDV